MAVRTLPETSRAFRSDRHRPAAERLTLNQLQSFHEEKRELLQLDSHLFRFAISFSLSFVGFDLESTNGIFGTQIVVYGGQLASGTFVSVARNFRIVQVI